MFCVVDIEGTGGKFEEEGIIEIALFKFDGKEVVDQVISLVNPESREIQPYVTKLTGITPNMVKRAPKFYELAKRIIDITKDNVLVAHNAEFDYRILQTEFNRLGYDFQMLTIDTITWAEKLIPDEPAYGLEKLAKSLGINHANKHRAEADARATLDLFKILLEKDSEKVLMSKAFHEEENKHEFKHLTAPLKNVTGVYYLLNKQGKVIYIGRSNFIKNRIERHFLANNTKAVQLQENIADIRVEETGNEILSRVKEYTEWRKIRPKFNNRKFDYLLPYGVVRQDDRFEIVKSDQKKVLWYFNSKKDAELGCAMFCEANGIDVAKAFPSKQVKGILEQGKKIEEMPKGKRWVDFYYPSPSFVLELKGRTPMEKCVFLVKNGIPKGYAFLELKTQIHDVALVEKIMTLLPRDNYIKSLIAFALAQEKYEAITPF